MIFTETKLKGAYVVILDTIEDERGFFARSFCRDEFKNHSLKFNIAQCNVSYNKKAGTLRGLHYQVAPHEEAKIVRCTRGAIYDVMVDMRTESPTFRQWLGIRLTERRRRMIYVPERFAHGYLSLTDDTMIHYLVSEAYHKESERTIRWDSPSIGIGWDKIMAGGYIMSEKDKNADSI